MIIAYTSVPSLITKTWLKQLQELIPFQLLQHVNLNKESVSLAHSLAGRFLLSEILRSNRQETHTLSLSLNSWQRPYLNASAWRFSISHSHRTVVCACSYNKEVGIDLEWIAPIEINDFASQLTDNELFELSCSDASPTSFYQLWTAKEAVSKAVEKDYISILKRLIFQKGNCFLDNQQWYTYELPITEGYCCTLVVDSLY